MINRLDIYRASVASLKAAKTNTIRQGLWLGLIYLGFALFYLIDSQLVLAILTGGSASLLLLVSAYMWQRTLSRRGVLGAYAFAAVIILTNLNGAVFITGDHHFVVSHMFVQLALSIFVPTLRMFGFFATINIAIAAGMIRGMEFHEYTGLFILGFGMSTAVSFFILMTRFRYISTMEELRASAMANRDRDFREIIAKNPDAVILIRDQKIAYANQPFATYLRLDSPRDVVGKRFETLVKSGLDRLTALCKGEYQEPDCLIELERADGECILVDIAEPKTITFEDAPATMLVARDVTASQAQLNARLLVADRMSAAGTLAAGVAHEINNPLTYVSINLGSLAHQFGESSDLASLDREAICELLAETREGVSRVAQIVHDMSSISNADEVEDTRIDPRTALRVAVKMVENQLRYRTQVTCNLGPLPNVVANDGKLVQVFLNILMNAAHALDDDADNSEPQLTISTYHDQASCAVIEVSDNGAGMTEQTRRRMFDPFFTTRPPGGGTGLGMFMCHSVIQGLGGRIEVQSKLGTGTVIRVRLPPAEGEITQEVASVEPAALAAALPMRVLIVDDEPLVGNAIARVLGNYDVTVTGSGEEAIRHVSQERFDLILCDIMMPSVSGQDVFERLTDIDPEAAERILFMTGGAFTPAARKFADTVQDKILRKPIAVDILLEHAKQAAERSHGSASKHLR